MLSMGNDVISYHGGGILKLGCKKPSSEKTVSRFKVDIEAYRNGEPSCRGQMRSQRGMVRGFVMTETGIPGTVSYTHLVSFETANPDAVHFWPKYFKPAIHSVRRTINKDI